MLRDGTFQANPGQKEHAMRTGHEDSERDDAAPVEDRKSVV